MICRGVRGATTADANTRDDILRATRELLALMIRQNGIRAEDVASVIISTTPDLDAEFPALAARQLGWHDVALLCNHRAGRARLAAAVHSSAGALEHRPAAARDYPRLRQGSGELASRSLETAAGRLGRIGGVDCRAPAGGEGENPIGIAQTENDVAGRPRWACPSGARDWPLPTPFPAHFAFSPSAARPGRAAEGENAKLWSARRSSGLSSAPRPASGCPASPAGAFTV